MRIVIDLEAAQSPQSRNRGIGRYSIALAKAMLRQRGGHEIIVALNGMYPASIGPVREALDGLLPSTDIVTWHATMPPQHARSASDLRAFARIRHAFLERLQPDIVHVASLFEFGPYSFATIGDPPAAHRTAVTLYDLIPHVYRDVYFESALASRGYDEKLEHLQRADLWLAISESSRQEGITHLGLPAERVTNISSAADEHFFPRAVDALREARLRIHYRLGREFVMYTGGIDPRKNIEGLIAAWAQLPQEVRRSHQLAIVCSVQPPERARLQDLARAAGFAEDELVMTGFVPEENLVDLYRLCKLFVFPSLHEGFGLPALEAMSCAAPVIAAGNSSIPEVIGRADALFDARSRESITAKIAQCLADEGFRRELARTGPERAKAFSWDLSAQRALEAIERLGPVERVAHAAKPQTRPRLAYVSPLPPHPDSTGNYSADLLPELAQFYDIDVVVDQPEIDPSVLHGVTGVRDARWFDEHGGSYDRIVYHFADAPGYAWMLALVSRHPGTVVLHDFFLSGLQVHRELAQQQPHLPRALYESHGWRGVARCFHASEVAEVVDEFPANFEALRSAQGVVVHSRHAGQLADDWYGSGTSARWRLVAPPFAPKPRSRGEARAELRVRDDEFLVCAFGPLGPANSSDRLLHAWQLSSLANDPRCRLVFVGETDASDEGRRIERDLAFAGNARVTGAVTTHESLRFVQAADVVVHLRRHSRGETSHRMLGAMDAGAALIVNATGSMAELPHAAAIVLDEAFDDHELVRALQDLRGDEARRRAMGEAGRAWIEQFHSPQDCARAFAQAIEDFASKARTSGAAVAAGIVREAGRPFPEPLASATANAIAHTLPEAAAARKVFFDIGAAFAVDPNSELPAVVRTLVAASYPGWRAEPVYRAADGRWRYARSFMLRYVGAPPTLLADDIVDPRREDLWCLLDRPDAKPPAEMFDAGLETIALPSNATGDLLWARIAGTARRWTAKHCWVDISELVQRDWQAGIARVVKNDLLELLRQPPAGYVVVPVYATVKEHGYRIATRFLCEAAGVAPPAEGSPDAKMSPQAGDIFFGLDLQPYLVPEHAQDFRDMRAQGVTLAFMVYDLLPLKLPDCFLDVGQENHRRWLAVVAESDVAICISGAVAQDLREWLEQHGARLPRIEHAHLGADIGSRIATRGVPQAAHDVLARMRDHPTFLMVGTLEPRKAYDRVIDAFEVLWSEESEAVLVISGRPGWMCDELVQRLRSHPESAGRLLWIEDASDEYLEELYRASTAMILASRGEGFGLPLVEAAQRGLPLVARDLPVFREVAGEHAFYFGDDSPAALAASLREWLVLRARDEHPRPEGMRWLTWEESAAQVRRILEGAVQT